MSLLFFYSPHFFVRGQKEENTIENTIGTKINKIKQKETCVN